MYTFSMAEQLFADCTLAHSAGAEGGRAIQNIQRVSGDRVSLEPWTLYVLDGESAHAVLRAAGGRPVMCIVSGEPEGLEAIVDTPGLSLLCCALGAEDILNRVTAHYFSFSRWLDRLHRLSVSSSDMQPLLDEAARQLRAPLFALNSGYRLVASNVEFAFEHGLIAQLLSRGYLSAENIDELVGGQISAGGGGEMQQPMEVLLESGNYCVLYPLKYKTGVFGWILALSPGHGRDLALYDYAVLLAGRLQEHALIHNREQFESDTEFSALIGDIIDQKISGEEELSARLFRLPTLPGRMYACVVVTFADDRRHLPLGLIIQSLSEIFRRAHIATYRGDLVILSYRLGPDRLPEYDRPALEELLNRFNGLAAFGNSSAHISSVRQIYLQARASIDLGTALRKYGEERIFRYDHYTAYHLIDLCARFAYSFHEGRLVYLCTPKYTALKRFDLENQDNLCQVLQAYIRSNCNTSQTAKALHFHRNTIINKVAKIESIIGESLDNWSLQFKLMLSCMVDEYTEHCAGGDLLSQRPGSGGETGAQGGS